MMIGEARPTPTRIANDLFPKTGSNDKVAWRLHIVAGVAPQSIDRRLWEEFLEQAMQANDSDGASNEFTLETLKSFIGQGNHPDIENFVREALAIGMETRADYVALTENVR